MVNETGPADYFLGKRYVFAVESVSGGGRFGKYQLIVRLNFTSLVVTSDGSPFWLFGSFKRAQRKGTRMCAKLNADLDRHEARQLALKTHFDERRTS